ncbi:hypothetical protein [Membranihabitans maritimus]|uniref:hypothetical protein n=1 Tax=Membranihabitans maritimus TaxID=2904244 RepID=UPI001F379268|nr:hypothetical protein [Membranihabitans maritimus]
MKKLFLPLLFLFILSGFSKVEAQSYESAIGARLGWGFAGSYKHFFSDDLAGEGIVNFRNYSGLYSYFTVTGLAQKHSAIPDLSGLSWYFGGGAYLGFYGSGYTGTATIVGIAGNLGLDYAFEDIPLNLSIDWIPRLGLTGGVGFGAESGGLAARYILN